jgi:tetratricopeptide (TPR) repeat protein
LDYYDLMMPFARLATSAALVLALAVHAQTPGGDASAGSPAGASSALTGELFYQLLLGELNARSGEPGNAYSLILDAARKTNDAKLYQRAADIALQARSGDSALTSARAWKQAQPLSREANRYVLQILIALNRTAESAEPLKTEVTLASATERALALTAIPRLYARSSDKKLAANVVEQALADALNDPQSGAAAWTAVGRMRVQAGDTSGGIEAAQRAQKVDATAEGPALLALELMDPKVPLAEPIVRKYLEGTPLPEVRMGYARALLDMQRYTEASQQLQAVTTQKPDYAEAWLVQGSLQLQDNQLGPAETSLQRYLQLSDAQRQGEERSRGQAQAYLSLAQIAEKRKDYAAAEAWLNKIENAQDLVGAQNRRASLLAKQGKMDEARALLRALPERNTADARMKLMAEVQLLRDNKQFQPAYDLLQGALEKSPGDTDLLYDLAMLAEKLGNVGEMERLLRQLIAAKPEYHHAYNALGYSLAERNVRLPEAKQLIQKALEFAPGDPFITDSLGWVEFRMGNKAEAARILDGAYKTKPDAEIAAHLGEVLWSMGQKERALSIWREGLLLNADNDTLQETLKRLRVKP